MKSIIGWPDYFCVRLFFTEVNALKSLFLLTKNIERVGTNGMGEVMEKGGRRVNMVQ
jgi:hypothetical protein